MSASQEIITNLQEQLALDDAQLAMRGIARSVATTEKEIAEAVDTITSYDTYQPFDPGPRPDSESGGMDQEDWLAASYESKGPEADKDRIDRKAELKIADAEDRLSDLRSDEFMIEEGDTEVAEQYAQQERDHIQAQIDAQQL